MTTTALIYRMVIACLAGRGAAVDKLYERYLRERYLHVSIGEILEAKREEGVA